MQNFWGIADALKAALGVSDVATEIRFLSDGEYDILVTPEDQIVRFDDVEGAHWMEVWTALQLTTDIGLDPRVKFCVWLFPLALPMAALAA